MTHHRHVDVVEIEHRVWNEASFRRLQANRLVQQYGLRLLPGLYEIYNAMPYEAAREMEVELGIGLKEEGYAVWQA